MALAQRFTTLVAGPRPMTRSCMTQVVSDIVTQFLSLLGCLHQQPLTSAGREHQCRWRPCDGGAVRRDGRGGTEHGLQGARATARRRGRRGPERRDLGVRRANASASMTSVPGKSLV